MNKPKPPLHKNPTHEEIYYYCQHIMCKDCVFKPKYLTDETGEDWLQFRLTGLLKNTDQTIHTCFLTCRELIALPTMLKEMLS
jgi:hypothetical protein